MIANPIELTDLDINKGRATVIVNDGDDWTAYQATFLSRVFYKDTSFDHAFGTHTEGEWVLELGDDIDLSVIAYEGKTIIACDTDKLLSLIYQNFYDDSERYIDDNYMEAL